jgi:2-keto-4-pentenoate hydratase
VDGILELAEMIDAAHRERRLLDAASHAPLDLPTAYAVQRRLTALRIGRGAVRIGYKLGYTSEAMREQMRVDQPNHGPLLDCMLITDGRVPVTLIHPRVEPEIALVVGIDLRPVAAHAALEVVDSIWWDYRFSLELNTADGSSAAGVVLGPQLALDALDTVSVRLIRNRDVVAEGTGAAAMGHPLLALGWLQRTLAAERVGLRPGDVVITGGLTVAVPIEQGDVVVADFGDGAATVALHRPGS